MEELFWTNAQNIFLFFQLPNLKNDILGVGKVAPAYQVIKNLKTDHLGLFSMPGTDCELKILSPAWSHLECLGPES